MSKPILATLLLMLQDEGLLSVDDPVEKYLPEFKGLKTADGKPAKVTIRHLLTHTSGMGEITAEQARNSKTLADVIPLYVAKPVAFTPGSKWVYCQSGINTGGRIAEVVTGEPLEKLLEEAALRPAGDERHHLLSHGETAAAPGQVVPAHRQGGARSDRHRFPQRQITDEPGPLPRAERRALFHRLRLRALLPDDPARRRSWTASATSSRRPSSS